jgi:mono/diheme cytochrome c family protein
VDYVVSLPIPDPPATAEGDAEAGEEEYAALCVNCHGGDGRGVDTGVQELNAPSLLHLNDWYIASSLRKYRDAVRGARGDGFEANMRAAMTGVTDERIGNVTAYIMTMQRLPRKAAAPPPPPLPPIDIDPAILPEGVTVAMVEEGQQIFNTGTGICFTCHVREGVGGALAPPLNDDEWLNIDGEYELIVRIIMDGVPEPVEYPGLMHPRANMPLTDEQVRAIAAYVFTLSR